jgi:histidinol-phosphatase
MRAVPAIGRPTPPRWSCRFRKRKNTAKLRPNRDLPHLGQFCARSDGRRSLSLWPAVNKIIPKGRAQTFLTANTTPAWTSATPSQKNFDRLSLTRSQIPIAMATDAISERLQLAIAIAQEAGDVTLRHFRRHDLQVERKADKTPVTIADRAAEELLRKRIAERFPDDAIIGEEFGATHGSSGYQWALDPIDGTKSFVHGVPLYTTLVAVLRDQQPLLGVIHAPAAAETVYASAGGGCWYVSEKGAQPRPARASTVPRLAEGLLLTTEIRSFAEGRTRNAMDVFQQLERAARLTRTWGDGYGYLMVATGRAEVMVDPELDLWDLAALQPVIEEAGGTFCDWQGRATVHSRDAIATNGVVTEEVLAITRAG